MLFWMFTTTTGQVMKYAKHDPGQKINLPAQPAWEGPVKAFVCTRCRLVYVPEEEHEKNPTADRPPPERMPG